MEGNTSPSSEEILEKLEGLIETKEESGDEEYKITILAFPGVFFNKNPNP